MITDKTNVVKQKIASCGVQSTVGAHIKEKKFHALQQTCKQIYCCEYCESIFQKDFVKSAQLLAGMAKTEGLQLLFLTLSYKPVHINDLPQAIVDIKKSFNAMMRCRLQKDSRDLLFYPAIFSYAKNICNQIESKNPDDQHRKKLLSTAEIKIDQQYHFYEEMEKFLPEKDSRLTHIIFKSLNRLEIKQKSDSHAYPHIHSIIAVPCPLPKVFLSEIWKKHSGSSIIHIEPIDNLENAARYVAKYMSKADGNHLEGELAINVQAAMYRKQSFWWSGSNRKAIKPIKKKTYEHVGCINAQDKTEKPEVGKTFSCTNHQLNVTFDFEYTSEESKVTFKVKKSNRVKTLKQAKKIFRGVKNISENEGFFEIEKRGGKWDCEPSQHHQEIVEQLFLGKQQEIKLESDVKI